MNHLQEALESLQRITDGCREDMHEPDEQDLRARVVGTLFDNAFGHSISERAIRGGFQELVVIFERDGELIALNLATLVALARKAAL